MTTITLNIPRTRVAPRAAERLGELFAKVASLLMPAARVAAVESPSRQAARVRAMAHQYEATDPRFASELFAAADRHESLHGE